MRSFPLLCVAAAAACASPGKPDAPGGAARVETAAAPVPSPPLPDAATIHAIFNRRNLDTCDELTCSYFFPRNFRVRAVRCRKIPHNQDRKEGAVCRYQRQLVPERGPPRFWSEARTRFYRYLRQDGTSTPWALDYDLTRGRD